MRLCCGYSRVQVYLKALADFELDVAGVHFHWLNVTNSCPMGMMTAIHHQNLGLDPVEFIRRTAHALHIAGVQVSTIDL